MWKNCSAVLAAAVVHAGWAPRLGSAAAPESLVPDCDLALKTSQGVIGKPISNHLLRDRPRREVHMADYLGKPLVLNFVYTSCLQVCPTTTQSLARTVKAARSALGDASFNVVTVGFNPPFDSPEAMAAFARQNGIDTPHWEFLSPDPKALDALTSDLGFTYYATPKGFDHISQVTIIDGSGAV
jgi:protein SCO1/2